MPVMPPLPLADEVVKAIAAYVRSVLASASRQGGPPPGPPVVLNVVVGDAAAGERYFAAKCSACHSPDTDLKGLATRVPDGCSCRTCGSRVVAAAAGRPGRRAHDVRAHPPRRPGRATSWPS